MNTKQDIVDQIIKSRDEARLRVHLLSMEARERWSELETKLNALEQRLTTSRLTRELGEEAREVTGWVERLLARHAPGSALDAKASACMSRQVRTCLPYSSLRHAVQALRSSGQGAVPVVDEADRLIGIVTEGDLCDAACRQGKPFSVITIDSAMTENVQTCSPYDSLERVLEIMGETQVTQLPVVDVERKVLGMIDFASAARFMKERATSDAPACAALVNAIIAVTTPFTAYATAAE